MRTLLLAAACGAAITFTFFACKDDNNNNNFCVENVAFSGTPSIGAVTFTLPNGEMYAGDGALPVSVTIGKYTGQFQSVVTKQTPTATGMDVELVHFFDDGKGNAFWTNDNATFTPTDTTFTKFQVYDEMTVVDGTGDFDCASGLLVNQGPIDFVAGTLGANVTGKVCGGCD